jgi:hypothetical protein
MTRSNICMLILFAGWLLAGTCFAGEAGGLLQRLEKADVAFDGRSVTLARQVTEKTVLAHEEYQGGPFKVLARKPEIERYRCSSCHNKKPVAARHGRELTHGTIRLNHGREGQALACIDCHHAEDRDYLEDKKGRKIDFDHVYQLCGQCHFRQKRDWLAGAHGKRVANWAGERVIYNCTTCHNPHSPKFASRFPATYSVPLD